MACPLTPNLICNDSEVSVQERVSLLYGQCGIAIKVGGGTGQREAMHTSANRLALLTPGDNYGGGLVLMVASNGPSLRAKGTGLPLADTSQALSGKIVKCAGDGESALRLAAEMRPDVVILDIGLPGMSGHAVVRRLRQDATCGQCLIVALSGYGHEEHVRRATEAGVDHYLVKPADPAALLESISGSENRRGSDGMAVS